jgi:N-acyl-D-amino-acid deacylase
VAASGAVRPGVRWLLGVAVLLLLAGCQAGERPRATPPAPAPLATARGDAPGLDLVLAGGRVVDGTGNPAYRADVGVRGDRIERIGDLGGVPAARRIDVSGLVVAPGFIDPHAHAVGNLFSIPTAEGYLLQGITTVVDGNDGSSPYPVAAFLDSVARHRVSPNLALFVGHGTVRRAVMGTADREPTAEELERMRRLVARGMEDGALGLSTGLAYVPGTYATTEEVVELARVAASHGGIYISHMRDEGGRVLDSVRETIRIGEEAGIPVQMTHHKVGGRKQFGQSEQSIELMRAARARGVDITFDQYPYTASSTGLTLIFPSWALAGDRLADHLGDPTARARVLEGMLAFIDERFGDDASLIQLVRCAFDPSLAGRTMADVLRDAGRPTSQAALAETIVEMQLRGGCSAIFHSFDEGDVERLLRSPYGMIGSDGSLSRPGEGSPHPRAYGTYPRVLGRYVRERGVLSLEEAIRKMTSFPATRLGLQDRGLVRAGMAADLTVFDPDRIVDRATFADPHQFPVGVEYVLVNGEPVVERGAHTGARPGRVFFGPARR